jgi:hypothetical protein
MSWLIIIFPIIIACIVEWATREDEEGRRKTWLVYLLIFVWVVCVFVLIRGQNKEKDRLHEVIENIKTEEEIKKSDKIDINEIKQKYPQAELLFRDSIDALSLKYKQLIINSRNCYTASHRNYRYYEYNRNWFDRYESDSDVIYIEYYMYTEDGRLLFRLSINRQRALYFSNRYSYHVINVSNVWKQVNSDTDYRIDYIVEGEIIDFFKQG